MAESRHRLSQCAGADVTGMAVVGPCRVYGRGPARPAPAAAARGRHARGIRCEFRWGRLRFGLVPLVCGVDVCRGTWTRRYAGLAGERG